MKAFIFDVDGVIIDTESQWEEAKKEMFTDLFGEKIYRKLGITIGTNIDDIYKEAKNLGATASKDEYRKRFFSFAPKIYETAPITNGIEDLCKVLAELNYVIAAVSASPKDWIDRALDRLSFKKEFKLVLSLDDRPDLPHKPAPDGYVEAIKELGSSPNETIVLEDSNAGIASAKAAGAYTIGLRQNLVDGQSQTGADIYASNLEEVIKIVRNKKIKIK